MCVQRCRFVQLNLPQGTFIIVAVDGTAKTISSMEVYVNTNVANFNEVIRKLEDKKYQYSVGYCSTQHGTSDSNRQTMSFLSIISLAILFLL